MTVHAGTSSAHSLHATCSQVSSCPFSSVRRAQALPRRVPFDAQAFEPFVRTETPNEEHDVGHETPDVKYESLRLDCWSWIAFCAWWKVRW